MSFYYYHLLAVKKVLLREIFISEVENYRFYIKPSIKKRCEGYARDALHDLGGMGAVW